MSDEQPDLVHLHPSASPQAILDNISAHPVRDEAGGLSTAIAHIAVLTQLLERCGSEEPTPLRRAEALHTVGLDLLQALDSYCRMLPDLARTAEPSVPRARMDDIATAMEDADRDDRLHSHLHRIRLALGRVRTGLGLPPANPPAAPAPGPAPTPPSTPPPHRPHRPT